jgi:hypothetical protein
VCIFLLVAQAKLRKGKASFEKAKATGDAAREEAESLRAQVSGGQYRRGHCMLMYANVC